MLESGHKDALLRALSMQPSRSNTMAGPGAASPTSNTMAGPGVHGGTVHTNWKFAHFLGSMCLLTDDFAVFSQNLVKTLLPRTWEASDNLLCRLERCRIKIKRGGQSA